MLESYITMKAQSCLLSGENPMIDLQIYFSMRFMMMMTKSELEKKSDLTDALHCTHKCWPFNSQRWLACNLSLWYPHLIQQTGHKKTKTYQVEVVILIQQILVTNLQRNREQLEGRINNQILVVKWLSCLQL